MNTNSYGKFKIHWSYADSANWINLPGTYASYKNQLNSDSKAFVQAMLQNYSGINLKKYEGLLIVGNRSNSISGGQEFTSTTFSTPSGNIQGVSFTYGLNSTNLEHNIGHTIFALEDLYLHPFFKTATSDNWPVKWDIMGGGSDFLAWHRWINRWLDDKQVNCLGDGKKSGVFYLTNINKVDAKVKLVSAVENKVATMAEYRFEPNRKKGGVIVYALDTKFGHGAGPMMGDETMIQNKEKIIKNGYTFEVIDVDSGGVYVRVSKI
jgi:M6 family metalloprotease-like protein